MDISKITPYLYVSSKLKAEHLDELPARKIQLAISMIVGRLPPAKPLVNILWLQTCDSIFIPIPMKELMSGVRKALPVIQSGQSVLVYCAKGRHRSIAMAAAILIAMGYTAREAMHLLRRQRTIADPQAWHISRRIHKFERSWNNNDNKPINNFSRFEETYAEFATRLTSKIILYLSGLSQPMFRKTIFSRKKDSIQKGNKQHSAFPKQA